MKNDRLSDALRRGDPANEQNGGHSTDERKGALLARCAAEPFAESASLPAAQTTRLPKTRWALPVFVGAGALTAAALYGMAAWFGASNHASQTIPAQIVKISPRPSAASAPHSDSSESVAAQIAGQNGQHKRQDTRVAVSTPSGRGEERAIIVKPMRQPNTPSPVNVIVHANRKEKAAGPRLVTNLPKTQTAPALFKSAEPMVERVIIEQDDTPAAEPTPPASTVAITINGRAESVVVSRAVETATN